MTAKQLRSSLSPTTRHDAAIARRKVSGGAKSEHVDVPPLVYQVLDSPGQPIDSGTRSFMESRFGNDLSGVRVHADAQAAVAAAAVGARAFTVGSHIVFGRNEYQPQDASGRKLVAHELIHVRQQSRSPVMLGSGLPIDPDPRLEAEAARGAAGLVTGQPVRASMPSLGQSLMRQSGPARATPSVDPAALSGVEEVRSSKVKLNESQMNDAEEALQARIDARMAAIDRELEKLAQAPKSKEVERKTKALEADKEKDMDQIIATPDSKYLNPERRTKILEAVQTWDRLESKGKSLKRQWQRFDRVFSRTDVVTTLGAKGFTSAELKALVAQESGDLTITDVKGDKAGVAQLGAAEVREAGGKAGDRLDPNKAIPLAAKVLINKANALDRMLTDIPTGEDYKRFVIASYNAGQGTIAEAQRQAKLMNRNPKSWQDLINGGSASPLYKAIQSELKIKKPDKTLEKFDEISTYPEKVLGRLPDLP